MKKVITEEDIKKSTKTSVVKTLAIIGSNAIAKGNVRKAKEAFRLINNYIQVPDGTVKEIVRFLNS